MFQPPYPKVKAAAEGQRPHTLCLQQTFLLGLLFSHLSVILAILDICTGLSNMVVACAISRGQLGYATCHYTNFFFRKIGYVNFI